MKQHTPQQFTPNRMLPEPRASFLLYHWVIWKLAWVLPGPMLLFTLPPNQWKRKSGFDWNVLFSILRWHLGKPDGINNKLNCGWCVFCKHLENCLLWTRRMYMSLVWKHKALTLLALNRPKKWWSKLVKFTYM